MTDRPAVTPGQPAGADGADGADGPLTAPLASAPEPLPGPALDSHCHLDMIGEPVADLLGQAAAAGITRVVTVGCDVAGSRWAAACAARYPQVRAAVAIHPNETARAGRPGAGGRPGGSRAAGGPEPAGRDQVLAEIASLAALPQVRAVGETGLDYYRDHSPPAVQRDWFRAHIEIAKQAGKALMIHDRDAHDDVLAILAADGAPEQVIFHCFSGDAELAKRCADAGYVMSFAGTVTFGNARALREAAAAAPAELILVETDAPFLTPAPNRGRRNAPAQAAQVLRTVAEVKGLDLAQLCATVSSTADRVFGPWEG